jgi:hypothetical protein|tara:strand:- start:174 stop:455 length:282 start_codon:yes stop_codon:yes gene_type:complete
MPKSEFYIGSDAFMVVDDGYYGVTGVWRPLFEIQKVMVINVGGIENTAYIVATCPEWTSSPQKILCVDACDLMTIKDAEKTLKEKQDKHKVST